MLTASPKAFDLGNTEGRKPGLFQGRGSGPLAENRNYAGPLNCLKLLVVTVLRLLSDSTLRYPRAYPLTHFGGVRWSSALKIYSNHDPDVCCDNEQALKMGLTDNESTHCASALSNTLSLLEVELHGWEYSRPSFLIVNYRSISSFSNGM